MEYTWPMRKFCVVGDPTQPIFYCLALGFCVGGKANLCFTLGVTQILAFFDTNMLVSTTRNCSVGGLSQCEDPARNCGVAVEYRL